MNRDLVIVGSGPAGLAAGLLAGRYDLDTTIFERTDLGGELVNRHSIDTYPGFPGGISGTDFRTKVVSQLREYDLEVLLAEVTDLSIGEEITLETDNGQVTTQAVILAAGASSSPLECPGAADFDGLGIFDCAMCDGPLYKGDVVGVYGGGERALSDSLYLSEFADRVIVITEEPTLSGPPVLSEEIAATDTISVRTETEVVAVTGEDTLGELTLLDRATGSESQQAVDGLLIRQGLEPNTEFLEGTVALTETGTVDVDERLATDRPGVFAAGTIRSHSGERVAAAIGDGATAFRSVRAFLEVSQS